MFVCKFARGPLDPAVPRRARPGGQASGGACHGARGTASWAWRWPAIGLPLAWPADGRGAGLARTEVGRPAGKNGRGGPIDNLARFVPESSQQCGPWGRGGILETAIGGVESSAVWRRVLSISMRKHG